MEQINETNFKRVCKALKKLPWEVWEKAVKSEPEWKETKPLLERYEPSKFLVFMVMAGLNDYQLKGVAEEKYWPLLVKSLMDKSDIPDKPSDFIGLLKSFYANERLYKNKLKRLEKFLNSELALKLWQMPLRKIAKSLDEIWYEIAETIKPKPASANNYRNRKTIVFAMKCLAISLLVFGIKDFEFNIPIPVDSRIKRLTFKLGLLKKGTSDRKIQQVWQMVLRELKNVHPYINMVHLDSFLWQKGNGELMVNMGWQ
jgi:DNA-(apurinic or apyrimidinic site) lyase